MLKKEFKDQFLPMNIVWLARESLKRLRHKGWVWDYAKESNFLMLDIRNMSKEDKLFKFISRQKGWAQTKLRNQGVCDLPTAMVVADCLVNYKMGSAINTMQKTKP